MSDILSSTEQTPEAAKVKLRAPTMTERLTSHERPVVDGIIYYADGGVRPTNPGHAGYGFHGYTYSLDAPKKGSGCANYNLTADGYIEKSKSTVPSVRPLNYIDGTGAIPNLVTNNVAELVAASWALSQAANYNSKKITVLTDSEMLVKGVNQYVAKWMANGWIKSTGLPVANQEYWKILHYNVEHLRNAGTEVEIKWIRSHNGHVGNEKADFLATVGVMNAKQGRDINSLTISPADGYWKSTVEKSPLLAHKFAYFISDATIDVPGRYYIGNVGKDDDMLGNRQAGAAFGVIEIDPEPVVELIKQHVLEQAVNRESVVMVSLDRIFSPGIYHGIMDHGTATLERPPGRQDRLDFMHISKTPITQEYRPPKLSMRAIESLNFLYTLLLSYRTGDHVLCATEITNHFFEEDAKAKKDKTRLKTEFNSGMLKTKVEVGYGLEVKGKDTVELHLGLDIPDRNNLKRMEKLSPKVVVLTWMESPNMFRYATVFLIDGASGIFSSVYSNTKFVPTLAA